MSHIVYRFAAGRALPSRFLQGLTNITYVYSNLLTTPEFPKTAIWLRTEAPLEPYTKRPSTRWRL